MAHRVLVQQQRRLQHANCGHTDRQGSSRAAGGGLLLLLVSTPQLTTRETDRLHLLPIWYELHTDELID